MAVAALRAPAVVYREGQDFAWWVYAVLAALAGVAWLLPSWRGAGPPHPAAPGVGRVLGVPVGLAVGLGVPMILVVGVLRMTTEVDASQCRVWFGWVPTYRLAVPLSSILRLEVVRFRPIADHGFWGVRRGPDGERVLTARGDRGVRLHLADGTRLLIGSQRPEALAAALEGALRPGI